jgi:isovaleryl-CoA dehydrogenase
MRGTTFYDGRTMADIIEKAEQVTKDVVAKHAARVDADGTFPEESMAALARAGLLGILSAPEVGGAGQGFGVAARVVERLAGSAPRPR